MARSATMLLILATCAVLATAVYASSECSGIQKYKFHFFEHQVSDKVVFSPSKENGKVGTGYVYDYHVTKNYEEDSEFYGFTGGMYFYTSPTKVQEVSTIFFKDIGEEGGTFANAEIHLRGVWNLDKNDDDLPNQELSIVGGNGGLSGAYGTVVYTKVGSKVWLVQGLIFVDQSSCSTARNSAAHIAQVISA